MGRTATEAGQPSSTQFNPGQPAKHFYVDVRHGAWEEWERWEVWCLAVREAEREELKQLALEPRPFLQNEPKCNDIGAHRDVATRNHETLAFDMTSANLPMLCRS